MIDITISHYRILNDGGAEPKAEHSYRIAFNMVQNPSF
jgi:hypothetical protein